MCAQNCDQGSTRYYLQDPGKVLPERNLPADEIHFLLTPSVNLRWSGVTRIAPGRFRYESAFAKTNKQNINAPHQSQNRLAVVRTVGEIKSNRSLGRRSHRKQAKSSQIFSIYLFPRVSL